MDCKVALERIAPFINNTMNQKETEEFLAHIKECKECREELEVTYSLMTAMRQLDEGTDLSDNYVAELNAKIALCILQNARMKKVKRVRRIVLGILIFLLIFLNGSTKSKEWSQADERFFSQFTDAKHTTK